LMGKVLFFLSEKSSGDHQPLLLWKFLYIIRATFRAGKRKPAGPRLENRFVFSNITKLIKHPEKRFLDSLWKDRAYRLSILHITSQGSKSKVIICRIVIIEHLLQS